jgi:hypothetical protein
MQGSPITRKAHPGVIGQLPAAGGGRKMTPALAAANAAGRQADVNPPP